MIGRLGSFLSLVGLTALLVGGVGVSNAVRAWLDTRLGVIATLKCIGASRSVVFATYLSQLTVIAGLGVLAGLAIGALVPVAVSGLLDTLLPVPIVLGVYPGVLALAVAFGLLTAVTFTVWPLSRAHETPAVALFRGAGLGVRPGRRAHLAVALAGGAALAVLAVATSPNRWFAMWFIGGAALALIVFRAAGWAVVRAARAVHRSTRAESEADSAHAPSPHDRTGSVLSSRAGDRPASSRSLRLGPRLRMAVSNLYRPGNATADIVLSLGLGLTVLVAVALVEGNLRRDIAQSLPEDAPAFFFVGVEADRIERLAEAVSAIDGTGRFRSVPFLRGRIVRVNGLDPEQALVRDEHAWLIRGDRGLSYETAVPDDPVVAGQWWPEDYAGPPLLSVDVDVIDAFDLALGDTITLNVLGREITAEVRHVRRVEWQGMRVNFALLLSPEPMRHAPHSYVATVGATPQAEALVERVLVREFPQVTTVRVRDALSRVAELMGSIGAAARGVGGVTLLSGVLVLAGAVAAGHRRRTYESVVLKVLGVLAPRRGPRTRGRVRATGPRDRGHRGRARHRDGVGGDHAGAGAGLDIPARRRRGHHRAVHRADPGSRPDRNMARSGGIGIALPEKRIAPAVELQVGLGEGATRHGEAVFPSDCAAPIRPARDSTELRNFLLRRQLQVGLGEGATRPGTAVFPPDCAAPIRPAGAGNCSVN